MDDFERWIYLDGPAPQAVHAVLDPIRRETWASAEETEKAVRAIAARVEALPLAPPDLNVRQYASLCVDMDWERDQVDAVRRRYGVRSAAEHEALDERWRRGLARSEDLRTIFEREKAEHALRRLKIVLR
jgi:hypothetical protein